MSSTAGSNDHRSAEQAAHERALGEVSDVMLNVDHTIARAKKAHARVVKAGGEDNVELALSAFVKDLERIRKRLVQDTYYAGDALRLL